jgi:hypothetical protein
MSRDLLNARRTLPIVHALSTLRGGSRERLQELLGAARESAECHAEVRTLLTAAGSMHYTALVVQVYRQRARNNLAAASPEGLPDEHFGCCSMQFHYCPWSKIQTVRLGLTLISGEDTVRKQGMIILQVFEDAVLVTLFVTFRRRSVPRIMLKEVR